MVGVDVLVILTGVSVRVILASMPILLPMPRRSDFQAVAASVNMEPVGDMDVKVVLMRVDIQADRPTHARIAAWSSRGVTVRLYGGYWPISTIPQRAKTWYTDWKTPFQSHSVRNNCATAAVSGAHEMTRSGMDGMPVSQKTAVT